MARYTNKNGKESKKIFAKLQDYRNWLADAQLEKDCQNAYSRSKTYSLSKCP